MARSASPHDLQSGAQIQQTLQALDSAVADTSLASISGLGIPQVRTLKREVAEIFPASNLPAFLLQGLLQLKGRSLDNERVGADLRVLFRETRQIGIYGAFIATPALIIHGYQRLLTLAGKDLESAFPNGTWQFYTEFGLREDAARHAVETTGFARAAEGLSEADTATCWVYAALHTLYGYDELLRNEWSERVALRCIDLALADAAAAKLGRALSKKAEERERAVAVEVERLRSEYNLAGLAAEWAAQRPYHGPSANPLDGYTAERKRSFERYLTKRQAAAPSALREMAQAHLKDRQANELPAYIQQMSIRRTLRADSYSERREPLNFESLCVALIAGGVYHLIALCERDADGYYVITPDGADSAKPGVSLKLKRDKAGALIGPYDAPVRINWRGWVHLGEQRVGRLRRAPLAQVRAQVAAAFRSAKPQRAQADYAAALPEHTLNGAENSAQTEISADLLLAAASRERQEALRKLLSAQTRSEIEELRNAPIIINWDTHDGPDMSLAAIRRSQRGCGDHALTIIRAGVGMIFDMSHIFFDGGWGSALAEIMTGFASSLAPRLSGRASRSEPPPRLQLAASPAFLAPAREAVALSPAEAWAETRALDLRRINQLRSRLAARALKLTVNDMLVLARYQLAMTYEPSAATRIALNELAASGAEGARLYAQIATWNAQQRELVPALLMPMDASGVDPRQRLHPATLRNPCPELLPRLASCAQMLRHLDAEQLDPALRQAFIDERTALCSDLLHFGAVMRVLREITMRGEGFNAAALKLMGHMPRPIQSLLDMIPQKIDLLNEIVKGNEVFSNIGQVARESSISRFMSARDDGETKLLIWGIMADAEGHMMISLRDFRPHVGPLLRLGRRPLADTIAADFLAAYVDSTHGLVKNVQRVLSYK